MDISEMFINQLERLEKASEAAIDGDIPLHLLPCLSSEMREIVKLLHSLGMLDETEA